MPASGDRSEARSRLGQIGWTLSLVASAALVGSILRLTDRGLDLTDEGFHLNSIARPFEYDASTMQFGFVYHPLYALLGGDIVLLRAANLLITLSLAVVLSLLVVRLVGRGDRSVVGSRTAMGAIAVAAAVTCFAPLHQWLPTPNYNWLCLQGLIVTSIGLVVASTASGVRSATLAGLALGIGGWMVFMAKPTTAVAITPLALAVALLTCRHRLWTIAAATASTALLLLISALTIDGSLTDFVHRFTTGAHRTRMLSPKYALGEMFRLDQFAWNRDVRTTFLIVIVGCLGLVAALHIARSNSVRSLLAGILAGGAGIATLILVMWPSTMTLTPHWAQGLWLLAPALGMVAAAATRPSALGTALDRKVAAVAVWLLVVPALYAFGTNNNYWHQAAHAGLFWMLFAALIATVIGTTRGRTPMVTLAVVAVSAQVLTTVLVSIGMEYPRRQPAPLTSMRSPAYVGGTTLTVTRMQAAFLTGIHELATQNGFRTGDDMIDATGQYPGALYSIGAVPVGAAWLIGGYAGSGEVFRANLRDVSCSRIARAWLLLQPDGSRMIGQRHLEAVGLDPASDYRSVGTITAIGGRYPNPSARQHRITQDLQLFKPISQTAIERRVCSLRR